MKPSARFRLVTAAAVMLWSGCSLLQPLHEFPAHDIGHFEYENARQENRGIVFGVPNGRSEPAAVRYGAWIRDQIGAGLVVGYDFETERTPVSQPFAHQSAAPWAVDRTRSVYPGFASLLQKTVSGAIKFYLGIRVAESISGPPRIEAISSGFSVEQLLAIKASYRRIHSETDSRSRGKAAVDLALNPEESSSYFYAVKNHGVLMLAQQGLILRLPSVVAAQANFPGYRTLLADWVKETLRIAEDRKGLPSYAFYRTAYGRIDSISSRGASRGIVLSAPHGSFDWNTAELVEELSYRTGLAAVIARGFTPRECGGWRINVNRPSERRYPSEDVTDRHTERSREVFQSYSSIVSKAAGGPLELYVEIHQSDIAHVDVATLNISAVQARALKQTYGEIRDTVLRNNPRIAKLPMLVEPIDTIEIGAWAAKNEGVLGSARAGLHIELPARYFFRNFETTRVYTAIMAELIRGLVTGLI